ncbi:uncharacterized protein LOC115753362 [Rhodamnia argentea]|uniref:Uncharacterized protein LOC115753362 n=1 Tax=Rhodamnia argentea TaxID=178133 RepID=A0A8B8QKX1_9MYRT|nr:uncharacterized protein LOC115753362 [Rhodamnia argentea]
MKTFSRAKRVTDPLDERARARLLVGADRRQLSYVSSGSEHGGEDCTPSLSELVQCFLEEGDEGSEAHSPGHEPDSDRVDSVPDSLEDVLAQISAGAEDSYRDLLLDHVLRALEAFSGLSASESLLRRRVMSYLREIGHNAAVCKSRWESSGGMTAGNYEFIDVLSPSSASAPAPAAWQQQQSRYFVDLDFAGEFEIARPTSRYARLLRLLPEVFVGTGDELKRIAKVMCDEAKRSLKSRELSVPPWRKSRYMTNKWLGPYRRTVNPEPANGSAAAGVKCRCVGFDEYAVSGRFSVRTR